MHHGWPKPAAIVVPRTTDDTTVVCGGDIEQTSSVVHVGALASVLSFERTKAHWPDTIMAAAGRYGMVIVCIMPILYAIL